MISRKTLCALLVVVFRCFLIECRSYNNGLIFYNLENHNTYLPPTISVSRGRGLAKLKYSSRGSIWSTFGKPCNCNGPLCGCCVGIKVKQYNFDQKMCANVSYVHPKDEVQLEVFLNDTATAKYGISARNPSPLCVPIMMGIPMSMCIQMSNVGIQGDNLNMCMDFLVRLASTELFEMHFQCMKMGLQGIGWVGADGQPVIPANEGKLKDKITTDSDEYYDESVAENEIISNEEDTEDVGMKEDLNKAEEEMDNNDITEKVRDIVKIKEQEALKDSDVASQENEVEGAFSPLQENKNVEEIVTNIMESINQGNKVKETEKVNNLPNESEQEIQLLTNKEESNSLAEDSEYIKQVVDLNIDQGMKTEMEQENKAEVIEESNEMQADALNSAKQETTDQNEKEENGGTETSDVNPANFTINDLKDEFNLEQLFKDSQEEEIQMESNQEKTQDTIEAPTDDQESEKIMTPIIVLEETTTQKIINEQKTAAFEMYLNTKDAAAIKINDNELHNPLEIGQSTVRTSTETMINKNYSQTLPQKVTVTSETSAIITMDDALTSAAITTTTSKPTTSNANIVEAETFIKNSGINADKDNNNDDHSEEEKNENGDDDDGDDDNSHENDSDYEDEESEEAENETKEKDNESITATTIIKSNANAINNKNNNGPKESLTLQEDANNSNSESQSIEDENENTNDEFETEEGEEYDEEYEDYETTTAEKETLTNNKLKSDNNSTCCKPVITALNLNQTIDDYNKKAEKPQIDTVASHNLLFVSKNNNMISQTTDDTNILNTKSTNKMSQATIDSTATVTSAATASSTNADISNVMPLPLARKLHLLHHHHQQQLQAQPQPQIKRQHRQRQHYV